MSHIQLRYFASVREALGEGEGFTTEVATLGELREALIARGGVYAQVLGRHRPLRMALDQVMAGEEARLRDGAEVAFFPPVTGG